MSPNQKICLLGYSGHGYVVAEALQLLGYTNIWYADRQKKADNPFELQYAGFEGDTDFPWANFETFALGVGDNHLRARIADDIRQQAKNVLTLIHPQALVSSYAAVGEGSFVARGACINPLVRIGQNVIINTAAGIDHECLIEDGAHIAPGAVLAGNVHIGSLAFVGANAVVREGISIGSRAVVGAGSVVLRDVGPDTTVAGNPARQISA